MHKGFKCLDIRTRRIYISRDVVFDEQIFPFADLHANVGARLRSEIELLPNLFDSSMLYGSTTIPFADTINSSANPVSNPNENPVENATEATQETRALPRVPGFVEGFLSDPRQRKSLSSAALRTEVLTALHPLPRVGPSAGRDPRHNHLFAES
jgi:hypothetical protein